MNPVDAEYYNMPGEEVKYYIIGVLLSQQSILKSGQKKFVKTGEKSSLKELTQLHGMTNFIPLEPNKLTREDSIKALSSIMFLVEKQDGNIKARTFTDGSKQRRDYSYKNTIMFTQLVQKIVS